MRDSKHWPVRTLLRAYLAVLSVAGAALLVAGINSPLVAGISSPLWYWH